MTYTVIAVQYKECGDKDEIILTIDRKATDEDKEVLIRTFYGQQVSVNEMWETNVTW